VSGKRAKRAKKQRRRVWRQPLLPASLFPGFFPPAVDRILRDLDPKARALAERLHAVCLDDGHTWLEVLIGAVDQTPGAHLADVLADDVREVSCAARYRAWWTIREGSRASLARIGAAFGRGKSDVCYGVQRHEARRKTGDGPMFAGAAREARKAIDDAPILQLSIPEPPRAGPSAKDVAA